MYVTRRTNDEKLVHLGLTRSDLEAYLLKVGLWSQTPEAGPENTHYVLSPCAYHLSADQRLWLDGMARDTYRALGKLDAKVRTAARKPKNNAEAQLAKLARRATRGLTQPESDVDGLPPIAKIDLVRARDGRFMIAEVDAYNPRGLAYLALLDATLPNGNDFGGIATVAQMLKDQSDIWYIVVSDFERYYERAFRALVPALQPYGVDMRLVWDKDLAADPTVIDKIDHVLIIPESLDRHPSVRQQLLERWQTGVIHLFYPPKAYLGSKAFLPFLFEQRRMRRYIPRSKLVSRRSPDPLYSLKGNLVLKGVMSSGMKQVIFSDREPGLFFSTYQRIRQERNVKWMVQEQVPQAPLPVTVFTETGDEKIENHFFRLTAYISAEGLIGAEVTGRPDPMVHGAVDCIMIPCV